MFIFDNALIPFIFGSFLYVIYFTFLFFANSLICNEFKFNTALKALLLSNDFRHLKIYLIMFITGCLGSRNWGFPYISI